MWKKLGNKYSGTVLLLFINVGNQSYKRRSQIDVAAESTSVYGHTITFRIVFNGFGFIFQRNLSHGKQTDKGHNHSCSLYFYSQVVS
jgi:hypothetical protein